jgi:hypothetical protein
MGVAIGAIVIISQRVFGVISASSCAGSSLRVVDDLSEREARRVLSETADPLRARLLSARAWKYREQNHKTRPSIESAMHANGGWCFSRNRSVVE